MLKEGKKKEKSEPAQATEVLTPGLVLCGKTLQRAGQPSVVGTSAAGV